MSKEKSSKAEPSTEKVPSAEPSAELSAKLAAKEAEAKDFYDQLLRLKAEFENYRKRVDREKPELVRYGRTQLLSRLLPLYDVLLAAHEQVVRHAELAQDGAAAELTRGLEMIFKEFTRLFESEGVAVIESAGKPYDFNLHEVLGQAEGTDAPSGTVVEELQRGYTLDGKTLRPAKVRVAK